MIMILILGNRNFDAHWHLGEREKIPCQEVYRGRKPFSESETRTIRDLMLKMKKRIAMYISIHTYGNSILYPNGYTTTPHPRKRLLHQVAEAGASSVQEKTGTKFSAGQSGSK